jgi:DNA-nicking Smr family endonuclease
MSRLVSPRSKPPRHRPLRGLKERARGDATGATKRRPPAAPSDEGPVEQAITFADAAKTLGVEALPPGSSRVEPPEPRVPPALKPEPAFAVREEEGWLEGYRSELGVRALGRLRGHPRATLDLHGARLAAAEKRLAEFIARAPYDAPAVVLIIVGKGRHSPGGRAVIGREIGNWLTRGVNAQRVLAFRTAPPELGGSGSILVLLKAARG